MTPASRPEATADDTSIEILSVEVDPADALEQRRELVDEDLDPERPVASGTAVRSEVVEADEADLAEQRLEVDDDDAYDVGR